MISETSPSLKIEDLSCTLGGVEVLQHVELSLNPGRSMAIVGPSGSGKSTLLAIAGLTLAWRSGTVTIHGTAYRELPRFRRPHVAWIPQLPLVLPGRSVLANCLVAVRAQRKILDQDIDRAMDSLDRVGIAQLAHRDASVLSGGELQRLAFARADVSGAPIILADEPTASLDRRNSTAVAACLADLRPSSALLVATHDMHMARACDVRAQIVNGSVSCVS